jgi:hypothetical protein
MDVCRCDAAKDTTSEYTGKATDMMQEGTTRSTEQAAAETNIGQKTREMVEGTKQTVSESAEAASKKAAETWAATKDKASEAKDTAAHKVSETAQATKEKASEVKDRASSTLGASD